MKESTLTKNYHKASTARRILQVFLILLTLAVIMSSMVAFAAEEPTAGPTGGGANGAGDGITAGINGGMKQVYNIITAVVLPIAAVCLAFCAFQIFLGGEKGMEKAKKIGIYTLVAVAVVYLAPVIVNTVSGWFSGQSGWLW